MIAIDNKLISDEVIEAQFVCDLNKCKGGCCEDGDAGAPLEDSEITILNDIFETVKPYLTAEGLEEINRTGRYHYDQEFGWVTPTIQGKMCAYGSRDRQGVIKCGIERAYRDGKLTWKKPISCHLYPIKTKKSKNRNQEYVNYEPREGMCDPACVLGRQLRIPVHKFLKEALVRKYGEEFYAALDATAEHLEKAK
ncbi:MAG TPA: DUF3109 family protein [Puia sp.]|nr:DUF3109 family protein [Puia sp.]